MPIPAQTASRPPAKPAPPAPAASAGLAGDANFAAAWTCEARELKPGGEPGPALTKPLTVGEKFLLTCEGPDAGLAAQGLALRLPPEQEHSMRLLEARAVEGGRATFVAVVYRVGDVKIEGAALASQGRGVRLQGLDFKVASVIDPKTNPEKKAYAPYPPMDLAYPAWIWLTLAALAAAGAGAAGLALKRRGDRARFARTLASQPIAGSAYAHFNKELRQLNRRFPFDEAKAWPPESAQEYSAELDRAFRWFLARALSAQTLERRPMRAGRALQGRERTAWRAAERSLAAAFFELSRALRADAKIGMTDCQQLAALCRKAADEVEASLRAQKGAAS